MQLQAALMLVNAPVSSWATIALFSAHTQVPCWLVLGLFLLAFQPEVAVMTCAGLFQIMAPYFGAADLHVKKPSSWPARSRSGWDYSWGHRSVTLWDCCIGMLMRTEDLCTGLLLYYTTWVGRVKMIERVRQLFYIWVVFDWDVFEYCLRDSSTSWEEVSKRNGL